MVLPSEQNTIWHVEPEILISISAYCSLSQAWAWTRRASTAEEGVNKHHKTQLALAIARAGRSPRGRAAMRCPGLGDAVVTGPEGPPRSSGGARVSANLALPG